ncbi:MAG: hypothetical protein ACREL3_02595 [Gemmatimonadales bacterium]
MARSISGYLKDDSLVKRFARVKEDEKRVESRVVESAVDLYTILPEAARRALRLLLEAGSATDRERLTEEMARAIARAQYESAQRQVIASMKIAGISSMTDEEIEGLAIDAGRPQKVAPRVVQPSTTRRGAGKRDSRGPARK